MPDNDIEYAGFWLRVVASLIDTVLIIAITFPLLYAIYGRDYFNPDISGVIAGPADVLITWVLPAIAVIFFWVSRQATPGKIVLSLRIVDAEIGGALSLGQSVGRYFGYFVSMLPLFLGLIWVAFDARKQGWQDKLAHTVVIKSRRPRSGPVKPPKVEKRIAGG